MLKYGVIGLVFGVLSTMLSFAIFTFVTGQWNSQLAVGSGEISALNLVLVLAAYTIAGCILGFLVEFGKKKKK